MVGGQVHNDVVFEHVSMIDCSLKSLPVALEFQVLGYLTAEVYCSNCLVAPLPSHKIYWCMYDFHLFNELIVCGSVICSHLYRQALVLEVYVLQQGCISTK
jgi:hypothetical protein